MNAFLKINTLQTLFLGLMLLFTFTACTADDESENLYPNVVSKYTYTFDNLTRTVTFTNLSTGVNSYFWDFGDGTTSTEKNPVHIYTKDGNFVVKLTVTNVVGTSTTYFVTIPVVGYFPLILPIDFENASIIHTFTDFGGAVGAKIANPNASGINTSPMVGKITKNAGSEVWAGTFLQLDNPVVFGTNNGFKMKVYSPKVGAVIKLN